MQARYLFAAAVVGLLTAPAQAVADDYQADSLFDYSHPHGRKVYHHHHPGHGSGSTYLRAGSFNPASEGLDNGIALGVEFAGGSTGRMEFGFSVDYYRNGIHDPQAIFSGVDDLGRPVEVVRQGDSYVSNHVPMFFTGRYFLPFLSETAFNPYVSGGLGYGIVWTVEHKDGEVDRDAFGGFAWQFGGGAGFHLAQAVSLIGEVRYVHNVVHNRETYQGDTYITRVDASGPSAWVGLRFGL